MSLTFFFFTFPSFRPLFLLFWRWCPLQPEVFSTYRLTGTHFWVPYPHEIRSVPHPTKEPRPPSLLCDGVASPVKLHLQSAQRNWDWVFVIFSLPKMQDFNRFFLYIGPFFFGESLTPPLPPSLTLLPSPSPRGGAARPSEVPFPLNRPPLTFVIRYFKAVL